MRRFSIVLIIALFVSSCAHEVVFYKHKSVFNGVRFRKVTKSERFVIQKGDTLIFISRAR